MRIYKTNMSTKSDFLQFFPDFTWDFTPEVIEKRSMDLFADIREKIEKITCLSEDKINFQSVCESLADIEAVIERERSIIEVYLRASPVGKMHYKSKELCKKWCNFFVEIAVCRDLYYVLTKVSFFEKSLPYESERYLEKSLLNKRRNGLHLELVFIEKLSDLMIKKSNLYMDFKKNLYQEDRKFVFEKQDLLGMPEKFFKGLAKNDGKYIVNLKSWNVDAILKHCKVIKTRQIIEKAHNSRCIDPNVKLLENILALRFEISKILGYKSHADFVTKILMAKSTDKVYEFLLSLFEKILDTLKEEMYRLLELKKEECDDMGVPFDGKINQYDYNYYQNMVEEQDYQIDKDLIKEYFPFEHVNTQLFEIYQTLLGLKFELVTDPPVIHSDVLLYAVYDKETYSLMGYFYVDLFIRPFKYSHAACYGIQAACHYNDKPQLACAYLISNFTKPMKDKPSLLTHEEIKIYFHELGHVMHRICSRTRYSKFQ